MFPYAASRSADVIRELLPSFTGVLLSDGYSAYDSYARDVAGVTQAQCWSHVRRKFLKAEEVEPDLTAEALAWIRKLYREERKLGERGGPAKLQQRGLRCKPVVDRFFA